VPLSALEVGQQATINRITKQDREVLEYLASRGLVPGCTVRLLVRAPFKGPLTLEHSGEPLAIAFELADAIHADVQADVRG
jgi:DtxR family Mn-dependent transcriptional regulator